MSLSIFLDATFLELPVPSWLLINWDWIDIDGVSVLRLFNIRTGKISKDFGCHGMFRAWKLKLLQV